MLSEISQKKRQIPNLLMCVICKNGSGNTMAKWEQLASSGPWIIELRRVGKERNCGRKV